jgi:hypothetical protein
MERWSCFLLFHTLDNLIFVKTFSSLHAPWSGHTSHKELRSVCLRYAFASISTVAGGRFSIIITYTALHLLHT